MHHMKTKLSAELESPDLNMRFLSLRHGQKIIIVTALMEIVLLRHKFPTKR